MASSGPNSPTITGNVTAIAGQSIAWTTTANITSSNDAYGSTAAPVSNQTTRWLKAAGFGFAIPGNAIIDGIVVEVEKSRLSGSGTLTDTSVRLLKNNTIVGQDRSSQGLAWTGTDAYSTYGGSTDTWGMVWTPSEVNSFAFGVGFSCSESGGVGATPGVDHIRITVYYTDGYVSAPQVQESSEIILFGQRYKLAQDDQGQSGKVSVSLATSFPPKIDTGGMNSRPSNPIVESYTVDDLRGGLGLWHYRTPNDLNRYWTAENAFTGFANAITLGPLATSIGAPSAEAGQTRPIRILQSFGTGPKLVALFNDKLYTYDYTSWSALVDTLPGASPMDTVIFNDRAFYALGSPGYSYQTDPTAVAVDVGLPAARSFAVWDNKLYALDTGGGLFSSTTGDSGSWTTLASLADVAMLPGNSYAFNDLVVYDDTGGETALWALTSFGPFIYDAVNDKWIRSRYQTPFQPRIDDVRGRGIVFRDSIYVHSSDTTLAKLTMTGGNLIVEEVSPGYPDGMPLVLDGGLNVQAADLQGIFVLSSNRFGNAGVDWNLLYYDGMGWQRLWVNTTPGSTTALGLALVNSHDGSGGERYRLFFHDATNSTTHIARWIGVDALRENPLVSTTRTYAASGYIELPVFDAWNASQGKIAQQVRVRVIGASSTETVSLSYRINESTGAYTSITPVISTDDEWVFPLGTNNTGIAFNSWQWKITMASSGSTSAPKIDHLTLDYVRKEEVQRGFSVTLDLSEPYFNRTPQQMMDHLWVHMKANNWGTFAYKDDSDNTRSYLVKVMRPAGTEGTGYEQSGKYSLLLIEMGPN